MDSGVKVPQRVSQRRLEGILCHASVEVSVSKNAAENFAG